MASIVPVAKALTLCDRIVGQPKGKVDLFGLFNAIRPPAGYPFVLRRFCAFAQLGSGLGDLDVHVDISRAATGEFVWATDPHRLRFPTREAILQVALRIDGCEFDRPGLYLVELYCDNVWVCDTRLLLRSPVGDDRE
jgi:hypothetical protein